MAKARQTPKGVKPSGVPNLHFFGEKDAPDQTSAVLDRRSIHGDRKIPPALKKMMTTQSVYVHTDPDARDLKVNIERVNKDGKDGTWRVDRWFLVDEIYSRFLRRLFSAWCWCGVIRL
jgi:hypothetical protein